MSQEAYSIILSYCTRLINIKPRTVFEINKKIDEYLKRRKIEVKDLGLIKKKVIKELIELKLLDDKKYALSFVELALINNPSGPVMLKKRLRNRGVDEKYIEEALAKFINDDVLFGVARKLAEKKMRMAGIDPGNLSQKEKAKIGRYLASKGIPVNMIWEILGEFNLG